MTCTWSITIVIVSPLSRAIPLPNGVNGLYMGVTNPLVAGMILQVTPLIGVVTPVTHWPFTGVTTSKWPKWLFPQRLVLHSPPR